MSDLVLIQMSGVPGAGKSTIARELGSLRGMTVLDHDIIKSALLDTATAFADAGPASYTVLLALVDDLLRQHRSVVIDSPCLYQELLTAGQSLASRHGAVYCYIECVTDDIDLLDRRLRSRVPLRSQRPSVTEPPMDLQSKPDDDGVALFRQWIDGMQRPNDGYLRLETTTQTVEQCVAQALALVDGAR